MLIWTRAKLAEQALAYAGITIRRELGHDPSSKLDSSFLSEVRGEGL